MPTAFPAFSAVRTLVLAFLIIASGLGAVFASPAQEAAAAGPCNVFSVARYGVSNGYYYIQGGGFNSCSYSLYQSIQVDLYAIDSWGNYTRIARASNYATVKAISAYNWAWNSCGVRYQVRTTHAVSGAATVHWSDILRVC